MTRNRCRDCGAIPVTGDDGFQHTVHQEWCTETALANLPDECDLLELDEIRLNMKVTIVEVATPETHAALFYEYDTGVSPKQFGQPVKVVKQGEITKVKLRGRGEFAVDLLVSRITVMFERGFGTATYGTPEADHPDKLTISLSLTPNDKVYRLP